jgi:hypothetical protein
MSTAAYAQFKNKENLDKFKSYFKVTDGDIGCAKAVKVSLYNEKGERETIPISYQDAEGTISIYDANFSGYRDGW